MHITFRIGVAQINLGEIKLNVVNLQGKVYYGWDKEEEEVLYVRFKILEEIIANDRQAIYFVDFHADATSEKIALATYFDGRVAAVVGTHTHVQTADERILEHGTGFITDAGMVGYYDSIIGADKQQIWNLFFHIGQSSKKHDLPAVGTTLINAVYLEIDEKTKHSVKIERIREIIEVK